MSCACPPAGSAVPCRKFSAWQPPVERPWRAGARLVPISGLKFFILGGPRKPEPGALMVWRVAVLYILVQHATDTRPLQRAHSGACRHGRGVPPTCPAGTLPPGFSGRYGLTALSSRMAPSSGRQDNRVRGISIHAVASGPWSGGRLTPEITAKPRHNGRACSAPFPAGHALWPGLGEFYGLRALRACHASRRKFGRFLVCLTPVYEAAFFITSTHNNVLIR